LERVGGDIWYLSSSLLRRVLEGKENGKKVYG
jgi:hypothetical protein